LVSAIVCAAAGLILWDVGTRSPGRALADIAAARTKRLPLAPGIARFIAGFAFLAVSVALVYLAVPAGLFAWYGVFQTGALLAALLVELLVGDDVRFLLGLRRGSGTR
jgi:hypothetical protein